jgi:hypothetical protein
VGDAGCSFRVSALKKVLEPILDGLASREDAAGEGLMKKYWKKRCGLLSAQAVALMCGGVAQVFF